MSYRAILLGLLAALTGCTVEGGTVQSSDVLQKILPSTPQQRTRQAFNINSADDRREGILALSKQEWGREGKYLEAYALLAKDEDPSVRSAAIVALGRGNDPAYLPVVVEALEDLNDFVRMDAAGVLDSLTGEPAVEPLRLHAGHDPKLDVRTRCLKALRHYPQPSVYETLLAGLDDPEFAIRYATRNVLREMTGEDCGAERPAWQRRLIERGDYVEAQQAQTP